VRTDSPWPGRGPGIWLAVVAVAVVATLGTVLFTARRTLRTPAVAAVTLIA
jgi:putative ABC transport system permease protein